MPFVDPRIGVRAGRKHCRGRSPALPCRTFILLVGPECAPARRRTTARSMDLGTLGEDAEECPNLEMILEGMTERQVGVNLVVIPPPDALMRQVPSFL